MILGINRSLINDTLTIKASTSVRKETFTIIPYLTEPSHAELLGS